MAKQIALPHNLEYRDYQKPIVNFFRNWGKRAVKIWHRRAWKDKVDWNICVEMAIREIWGYAYILPTYAQGKKIIWDSIDKEWKKFRDHIPPPLMIGDNWTELKVNLINWSFIQVLGSDTIDNLRGISPRWIVFSEYAFQNPTAWEVMRPILAENGWWALFNSTPSGKNHFYDLCKMAEQSYKTDWIWFYQKLTVNDTKDSNGNPIVSKEYIEEERKSGMSEEMIQQEFYCSFEVGSLGAYYADLMQQAHDSNRITELPKNISVCDIYFDLWRWDATAVWFKQNDWQFFNFIHYYESNGKHISKYFDYVDDFISKYNLQLWTIYFPHDSSQIRIEAEKTTLQQAQERYWSHKVHYIERTRSVKKDRDRVRELLPRCRFDADGASLGVKVLENYKKKWDDKKKVFSDEHEHDWASHWADSFRYFAVSHKDASSPVMKRTITRSMWWLL